MKPNKNTENFLEKLTADSNQHKNISIPAEETEKDSVIKGGLSHGT